MFGHKGVEHEHVWIEIGRAYTIPHEEVRENHSHFSNGTKSNMTTAKSQQDPFTTFLFQCQNNPNHLDSRHITGNFTTKDS